MPPFGSRLLKGAGLAVLIALAGAGLSSSRRGSRAFRPGSRPMSARARGRSRPSCWREPARSISARARSAIPATSPWTRRVPMTSAKPTGAPVLHHLRSRRVVSRDLRGPRRRTGSGRGRGFLQRTAVREEFRQRDGFRPDHGRRLCDGRDRRVLQGVLSRLGRRGRGFHARVPEVRRRRRDRERQRARHRRTSGGPAQGSLPSKGPGKPARRPGRLRSVRKARELRCRAQRRLHQLVALGRRDHHGDGAETIRPRSTSIRSRATSTPSRGRSRPARRRRARGSIGTPRASETSALQGSGGRKRSSRSLRDIGRRIPLRRPSRRRFAGSERIPREREEVKAEMA